MSEAPLHEAPGEPEHGDLGSQVLIASSISRQCDFPKKTATHVQLSATSQNTSEVICVANRV